MLEPNYCAQQGYPVSSLTGFCFWIIGASNDADVGATSPFALPKILPMAPQGSQLV